ncbi:MAG: response regulator [Chloroflexaceae bacterium]
MQILLVEDNPLMEQVLCHFLSSQGYEVVVANDGQMALNLAHDQHCHLMLLDLMLPDADGAELLDSLRELPGYARCPAIAMSGLGEEERSRSQEAGFNDYLSKPIDLDDLLDTVRRHCNSKVERVMGITP